jgi:lipoteichoic acid synthase
MAQRDNDDQIVHFPVGIKGHVSGLSAGDHQFPIAVLDWATDQRMTLENGERIHDQAAGFGGRCRVAGEQEIGQPLEILAGALFYATLGPWLVSRALGRRWRGEPAGALVRTPRRGSCFLGPVGLILQALGFGSLSLLTGPGMPGAGKSFARDPFVNLIVTGVKAAMTRGSTSAPVKHPAVAARLVRTPRTERRNVVLVHLESIRAWSVTPYNAQLKTTPFLDELAKKSLLAERAYGSVPFTSKASVATNCGIFPHPVQLSYGLAPEASPGAIPARCLPDLLKDQGYGTAYFTTSEKSFEDFGDLVNNFGYEELYSYESMDKQDYSRMRGEGLSGDEAMMEPSEEWLTEQKESGKPFLAAAPPRVHTPKRASRRSERVARLLSYLLAIAPL